MDDPWLSSHLLPQECPGTQGSVTSVSLGASHQPCGKNRPTQIWATANDGDTLIYIECPPMAIQKAKRRQMAFIFLPFLLSSLILRWGSQSVKAPASGETWRCEEGGCHSESQKIYMKYWSLGSKPSKPRLSQKHEKVNRPLNSILLMSIFVMFLRVPGCSTICKR